MRISDGSSDVCSSDLMFRDWVGILLLAVPIFAPLMLHLMYDFDGLFGLPGVIDPGDDPETAKQKMQLWFGAVYMVNMQMSFLSPPFGYSLFYLKSVAPDRKSTRLNSSH